MERIVGEIAFQLDRRILSHLFPDRVRLYGFNVSDIPEKGLMLLLSPQNGSDTQLGLTEEERKSLSERYNNLMSQLKYFGYDPKYHATFTEHIVNTYGILRERPDTTGIEGDVYNDFNFLRNVVQNVVTSDKYADCMMLLNCLHQLSQNDGKPLFIW
ncbi:speriolin-like [Eublepharis macularius]|uniref:Speriolin-like n=1 Tax=Eublepharis macularius TaxID=481883 RepID=A0AA97L302_EUBMA|nr:speriolin-like [Eublepharis macularius]